MAIPICVRLALWGVTWTAFATSICCGTGSMRWTSTWCPGEACRMSVVWWLLPTPTQKMRWKSTTAWRCCFPRQEMCITSANCLCPSTHQVPCPLCCAHPQADLLLPHSAFVCVICHVLALFCQRGRTFCIQNCFHWSKKRKHTPLTPLSASTYMLWHTLLKPVNFSTTLEQIKHAKRYGIWKNCFR